MSKILYPIFNLPNENDDENEAIPIWIKWWLFNNYKKSHSWVLSEIITGNPLTLNDSVKTKFYLPPLPKGNSEQDGEPSPTNEVQIQNVTGDVEVLVQNKNLWDKDGTNFNGQTGVNNFNAKKVIQDSAIGKNAYSLLTYNTRCVAYFKGKIGLSYCVSMDSGFVITAIKEIDDNGIITSTINTSNITLTQKSFAVMIRKSDSSDFTDSEATKLKDSIQIEPGTTATPYTPHQEQTFTFPLGSQRMFLGDYLGDDGIHHVRGQVVLVGTEQWFGFRGSGDNYSYRVFGVSNVINANKDAEIMSDYFMKNMSAVLDANNNGIYIYANNTIYISIDKSLIANVEPSSFKTWLSTHNVTVEYELPQEEITPYTESQQAAYDEIKQAISYEEQTNIFGSSNEASPIFKVQYYMKNESEGD